MCCACNMCRTYYINLPQTYALPAAALFTPFCTKCGLHKWTAHTRRCDWLKFCGGKFETERKTPVCDTFIRVTMSEQNVDPSTSTQRAKDTGRIASASKDAHSVSKRL